jgi:hypothetical protein
VRSGVVAAAEEGWAVDWAGAAVTAEERGGGARGEEGSAADWVKAAVKAEEREGAGLVEVGDSEAAEATAGEEMGEAAARVVETAAAE